MQMLPPEAPQAPPLAGAGPAGYLGEPGTLGSAGARKALAGFFVSGVLLAFLGAILPSWEAHLSFEYSTVGLYFLGLIAGLLASVWASPPLLTRNGIGWTLSFACAMAAVAL